MATETEKKVNNELNVRFGEHLRSIRESKKLSLRGLAKRCNLDNSNISKIEHGKFDVQLSTIFELAKGLKIHPKELLNYDFE